MSRRERFVRERMAADADAAARVEGVVLDAFVDGSLALAGLAAGHAEERERCGIVERAARLDLAAVEAWVQAFGGWRVVPREGASPPELVVPRLERLAEWLRGDSGRELAPAAAAALVLARLMEIRPVDEGNGRLARIAARHVLRAAGGLGFVLREEDREELRGATAAAQSLETAPLVALVERGVARATDLAVEALAG